MATASAGTDSVTLTFDSLAQYAAAQDPSSYVLSGSGYIARVISAEPIHAIIQTGSNAQVVDDGIGSAFSNKIKFNGFTDGSSVGTFLDILSGPSPGLYRITAVLDSTPAQAVVTVDANLEVSGELLDFHHVGGVSGVKLSFDHISDGATYTVAWQLAAASGSAGFVAQSILPRLLEASLDADSDAFLTLRFSAPLKDTGTHTVSGSVQVKKQWFLSADTVVLQLVGLSHINYTVTSSVSDVAGNPIDPLYNSLVFTGYVPVNVMSVFTNKGPIAKRPLTLGSGASAIVTSPTQVSVAAASFASSAVGKLFYLAGTPYRVLQRNSATVLTLQASLQAGLTPFAWSLVDNREGQLADDPSDVVVRVNGTPVTVERVDAVRGQIVLASQPGSSDTVAVDYDWLPSPTVDLKGLNSAGFRLNAFGSNNSTGTAHSYKFNTVLPTRAWKSGLATVTRDQPAAVEFHYRAFELAYSAVLNNASSLVLNTPTHRIAYPPAVRPLEQSFQIYEANDLPETSGWSRRGASTGAHVSVGNLYVASAEKLFWVLPNDTTFDHTLSVSWRFELTPVTYQGVWTGIAAGYADTSGAYLIGYLEVSGQKRIGYLKEGAADPSLTISWETVPHDWSIMRTYRIFRTSAGVVKVFTDDDISEVLTITSAPSLSSVPAPFKEIQGSFFGVLGTAESSSRWDFFRSLVVPTNSQQSAPSSAVDYEGTVVPDKATSPWIPVGSQGAASIYAGDFLILDSASSSTLDPSVVGTIGGDYKGYFRLEPLFRDAAKMDLDTTIAVTQSSFGIDPDAVTLGFQDGSKQVQLSFLSDIDSPKLSYGGQVLPDLFGPWAKLGSAPTRMAGKLLRIDDTTSLDGALYYQDTTTVLDQDYALEFRVQVLSYVADPAGFVGVNAQAFDGARLIGLQLIEVSGTKYVELMSDGVPVVSGRFAFDWSGGPHTYRLRRSVGGSLVTVIADNALLGSMPYSSFQAAAGTPQVSFGSANPTSSASTGVALWYYVNAWKVLNTRKYVGIRSTEASDSFHGYHIPTKAVGTGQVAANALGDVTQNFVGIGVAIGDLVVVDTGPNRGTYEIASVAATVLTFTTTWPVSNSEVSYRVLAETDWTVQTRYRLSRTPLGEVTLIIGNSSTVVVRVPYSVTSLPPPSGLYLEAAGGLPSVFFGSFSRLGLAQSWWDRLTYFMSRTPNALATVPQYQQLNQWNGMSSPERLYSLLPHTVTGFKTSSTGIVPKIDPDFLADPALKAFTTLNTDTPIMPLTQEAAGMYSALDIIRQESGVYNQLAPADDALSLGTLNYTGTSALTYTGDALPEATVGASAWQLVADQVGQTVRSVAAGSLTFGAGAGVPNRAVYLNNTPLPDAPSLSNEVVYRMRLTQDSSSGTGDSQVRLGLSAPGMTLALAFVTDPETLERLVLVRDLTSNRTLGALSFDFLDGLYHTYRVTRDPCLGTLEVFIDT